MASVRELTLRLTAETKGMSDGVQEVNGKMSKLGGMLKGAAVGMAAAFSVEKVIDFGKQAIDEASSVSESISKIGQVFGKSAGEATKFAQNANQSLGLSDRSATEMIGTLGNMWKGFGKTNDEALGASKGTMQLAADLGSFNNLDTTDVLDMMSSSFRGEYDSIQRILPGISGASVAQEALAMTGKKSADQLTASDKAAASMALMMKQAGPAVGDFARTSGGAANQQKILQSKMDDLKNSIGQGLLPAFTAVLSFIVDKLFPGIKWFVDWISNTGVPALVAAWDFAWTYIKPVFDMLARIVMALYNIYKNVIGLIINLITGDWQGAWDSFKKIIKYAIDFVMGYINLLWHYIQMIWNLILMFLKYVGPVILDVILYPYKLAWDLIKTIAGGIWHGIQWIWDGMLNTLKAAGNGIKDAITWPFREAWSFIQRTWNNTLGKIHIKIPDWVPGLGGKEFNFPRLAQGGIVSRPTLALIGERGPEAVIPLNRSAGALGGGGNVYNINVNTGVGDAYEIGRTIVEKIQAYERVAGPRRSGIRGGTV